MHPRRALGKRFLDTVGYTTITPGRLLLFGVSGEKRRELRQLRVEEAHGVIGIDDQCSSARPSQRRNSVQCRRNIVKVLKQEAHQHEIVRTGVIEQMTVLERNIFPAYLAVGDADKFGGSIDAGVTL